MSSQTSKPKSWFSSWSMIWYAVLLGLVGGIIWGVQPVGLSRWRLYQAISLGLSRDDAVALVESSENSLSACGAYRWENRDSVCRFEDPWRGYVINFDPNTKLVNRKYYYFKRVPGVSHPSSTWR